MNQREWKTNLLKILNKCGIPNPKSYSIYQEALTHASYANEKSLKYNYETHNIDKKIGLDYVKNTNIDSNECILLVEGNHVTGKTANIAVDMIRKKFGDNVKIIYVSLTRDYTYRNSVNNVCFTTWAMTTNEMKELSEDECKKLNINYNLVSVYPWENIEEELNALNSD